MHLLFIFSISLILSISVAFGGMPGGWSEANPTDPNVISIAKFAIESKYGNAAVLKKVKTAFTQVVRGINYDLKVETNMVKDESCVAEKYVVWDDLGKRKLISHEFLVEDCNHGDQ